MKKIINKYQYVIALGILIIVLIISISYISTHAKQSKVVESGRAGYEVVTAIPGVTFEVNKDLADYATGVTEVSKNVDFVKNATYSYQNNRDTYMQFNMAQYIVIACKGTQFNFDETSIPESLNSNSLNGIWFTNAKNVEENDNKVTIDVEAQVVITNTVYNDFSGKLCTITSDDEEWSLFIGAVNIKDADMLDMIKYVVGTFNVNAENKGVFEDTYEVTMDTSVPTLKLVKAEVVETYEAPVVAFTDIFGKENEEPVNEEPVIEDIETPDEEMADVKEPEVIEEQPKEEEPAEKESEEPATEEIKEIVEELASEPTEEKVSLLSANTNQVQVERTEDKAYTSTIYSMLSVGYTSYFQASDSDTASLTDVFVKVTNHFDEEETKQLISEYIASGDSYYKEMEAPMGTHWEAIEYDVKCTENPSIIVNTRLVGLDGKDLVHRGIKYTKRTYNIDNKTSYAGGWTKGYIAFYAVPTSCLEYSIAVGEEIAGHGYGAYYRIER